MSRGPVRQPPPGYTAPVASARPFAPQLHAWLQARVRAQLAPRAAALAIARDELRGLLPRVDALDDAVDRARAEVDPGPFRPDMTVHAAHARHPGVRGLFAARGLPGCPACAVGADETLAEACTAEGLSLPELLDALRALES